MDKRYNTLSVPEQLMLRKQAVDDVLAHPEWSLAQAVRHLKKTMRLTTAEMAKLSGVSYRTMQDIEQERSEGTVQTMNRIFDMLGLKLTVARAARDSTPAAGQARVRGGDDEDRGS
jgi:DNA-binding XRE family transcriptional regulator